MTQLWTTTMAALFKHQPSPGMANKLSKHTGLSATDDETPVSLLTILDSNGIDDALWWLCTIGGMDRQIILFKVWCARQVQHLMTDPRSIAALDVAERYANGEATEGELAAAEDAAEAAAWRAAGAAVEAATGVALSAVSRSDLDAWNAASLATCAYAEAVMQGMREAVGDVQSIAWETANAAVWAAAVATARAAQEAKFREMVG